MARRKIKNPGAQRRTMRITDPTFIWARVYCTETNRLIADFFEEVLDLMRRCDEVGIDPFEELENMIQEARSKKRKRYAASSGS